MKILGLYSGKKQRKPKTPVTFKEEKDLICRDFTAKRPNEKWCADISYIPIRNCFLYLSVILDLYARKIAGWVLKNHMEQSLIIETFDKALKRRNFSGILIFHSDRGSQYRANNVQKLLLKQGIQVSQGLNAYDNAATESFFGSLKAELMPLGKGFNSPKEAKLKIFEYFDIGIYEPR